MKPTYADRMFGRIIRTARSKGLRARLDNKPRSSNPYVSHEFRVAWMEGYDRATANMRGKKRWVVKGDGK